MSVKTPATSLQLKNEETPHPPFLCHSFLLSHSVPEIKSHQPFSNSPPPSYTLSWLTEAHPSNPLLSAVTVHHFCLRPWLTEVGACELSQDAEGTRLGGASAGLPVLSVLNQPLLAAVVGNKTGDALHPEAVPAAHTHPTAAGAHSRCG